MDKIKEIFRGFSDTMVTSVLEGWMGRILPGKESAQLVLGDFCFFAGKPDRALAEKAAAPIMVPQNENWAALLCEIWDCHSHTRYAMKKNTVFDVEKLKKLADCLEGFALHLMDEKLYTAAGAKEWAKDLRGCFAGWPDFARRGLGVCVLQNGALVSGAASYTAYPGGIEIEIDTDPVYQGIGLATACGAKLILGCLARGLYPSWDAHDLRSLHLAEKLGYELHRPYTVYIKNDP